MIIVASGLDANGLDPLARMLLHSETYRAMTERIGSIADRLCGGRLVVIHEGGYAEAYVPFCGLAMLEALSGVRTQAADPILDMLIAQQPTDRTLAFQLETVDRLARTLGA